MKELLDRVRNTTVSYFGSLDQEAEYLDWDFP